MPNLSNVKFDALYSMFKGEPGTRKSTAALSYPKPIYIFDIDQKIRSLALPAQKWGINLADVDYDPYTDYDGIRKKLEQFQLNCKYKTIVVDSITGEGDAINRQTMRLKSGTTNKEGGEKGMRIGGISVNSLEDYKAEASAFNETVALTKDILNFHNCNIILIAHVIGERNKKDSGDQTHFARIIVTGGKIISAKIPAYCEEVYHFNVESDMDVSKEGKYGLVTAHTGDDFARTALPLDRKIIFGSKPLYSEFIAPAIEKLRGK